MTEYVIWQDKKTFTQTIADRIIATAVYSFFLYISLGSTFWTFIAGSLFLLFVIGWLKESIADSRYTFRDKEELQEWVDKLP